MKNLSDLTVLIVDPSEETGFKYRKSFVEAGADTHVVSSFASAKKFIETKKIDAALVHYSQDPETVGFCMLLSMANIPCIFTAEPPARYAKRKPSSDAASAVRAILEQQSLCTVRP